MRFSMYVIDDEKSLAEGIALSLKQEYRTESYVSAEAGLAAIGRKQPDLVLLDIGLPEMGGLEALARIKAGYPDIVVIMITAYEDVETVVTAMRSGAYDYVVKPVRTDSLKLTIEKAADTIRLKKEVEILQERCLREKFPFFVSESKTIQDVMKLVKSVGKSPQTPVLIQGDTGTGKELIASAIHFRSPNFKGPFVTVNCAAIPKDLVESELFGYEKGAFSGAGPDGKKGLVEEAKNGTLFLDEIGDLSLAAQAKLLRFLESGEFYRVGGTRKITLRPRIVSATNKNIEQLIEKELFREDLYYRIGVVRVALPSLNERPEDVLLMAKQFLVRFGKEFGKNIIGMSHETESALMRHDWRGNVRELKNMMERAALVAKDPELVPDDLGLGGAARADNDRREQPAPGTLMPLDGLDLVLHLQEEEKRYIQEALRLADGNETKAAQLLHVKYSTLRYRRRKLNIS